MAFLEDHYVDRVVGIEHARVRTDRLNPDGPNAALFFFDVVDSALNDTAYSLQGRYPQQRDPSLSHV
jgi:hypothetical protein